MSICTVPKYTLSITFVWVVPVESVVPETKGVFSKAESEEPEVSISL